MAIVKDNILIRGLSGRIGDVVVKHYKYGTVVAARPGRRKRKATKPQVSSQLIFLQAIAYARNINNDPKLKAAAALRNNTELSVYHFALQEFHSKRNDSVPPLAHKIKR